jgi:hypothetical protein
MQDALPLHTWLPFVVWLFEFAVFGLTTAAVVRVFSQGGVPGWGALIPFYNLYLLVRLAGKQPQPWLILLFFPCVNVVCFGALHVYMAKRFGRSPAFGLGMAYLPFVFYPILAFGRDVRQESLA